MQKNEAGIPWLFFILTYLISWIIWSPGVLATYELITLPVPWLVFFAVGTFGPFLAAIIVSISKGGKDSLNQYFRHIFAFTLSLKWTLISVFAPVFLASITYLIIMIINPVSTSISFNQNLIMVIPTFLIMFFIGGGNEEFGRCNS